MTDDGLDEEADGQAPMTREELLERLEELQREVNELLAIIEEGAQEGTL